MEKWEVDKLQALEQYRESIVKQIRQLESHVYYLRDHNVPNADIILERLVRDYCRLEDMLTDIDVEIACM